MITTIRTDSSHPDFRSLVEHLDRELSVIDGDDHAFYDQYNKIDSIRHAIVLYEGKVAVACGAIKEFSPGVMEVKRMYTRTENRGKGIATQILLTLEQWATELGYEKCILETGKRQVDAVALYKKNGYEIIPNYGQYAGVENSVCFEKKLISSPK